jgi:hypothetical protein
MELGIQLLVAKGSFPAVDTARVAKGVVECDFLEVVLTFLVYGYLDSATTCVAVATGEASMSRASMDDEG